MLLADEEGRPLAVTLIQGTWHLAAGAQWGLFREPGQRAVFADVPGALDQRHGERDHLFVGQDQRLEDEAGGVDEIGVWHRLTTPAARARA